VAFVANLRGFLIGDSDSAVIRHHDHDGLNHEEHEDDEVFYLLRFFVAFVANLRGFLIGDSGFEQNSRHEDHDDLNHEEHEDHEVFICSVSSCPSWLNLCGLRG